MLQLHLLDNPPRQCARLLRRVAGLLGRTRRGLILTTEINEVWVIEYDEPCDELIDSTVIVDGAMSGIYRLRADWIGPV